MEAEYEEEKAEEQLKKNNSLIKKENNRLKKLFKAINGNQKKLSEKLIENASFMSVTLDNLKEDIKKYGVKETYMNGKDQFGFKESVEAKNYNAMIKNYMNIIKQLNDMLPEDKHLNPEDELDRFNGVT